MDRRACDERSMLHALDGRPMSGSDLPTLPARGDSPTAPDMLKSDGLPRNETASAAMDGSSASAFSLVVGTDNNVDPEAPVRLPPGCSYVQYF